MAQAATQTPPTDIRAARDIANATRIALLAADYAKELRWCRGRFTNTVLHRRLELAVACRDEFGADRMDAIDEACFELGTDEEGYPIDADGYRREPEL